MDTEDDDIQIPSASKMGGGLSGSLNGLSTGNFLPKKQGSKLWHKAKKSKKMLLAVKRRPVSTFSSVRGDFLSSQYLKIFRCFRARTDHGDLSSFCLTLL